MRLIAVCVCLFLVYHKFVKAQFELKLCSFTEYNSTISSKSILEGLVPCKSEEDCDDLKNATCVDGICECNHHPLKVCETVSFVVANKIGGKCENYRNCNLNNSACSPEKRCVCQKGYVSSSDRRRCLKIANFLGEPCEETVQCSSKIASGACLNNKCTCHNHTHHANKGFCYKNIALGEKCFQDEECSLTASSSCINSKCSCIDQHIAINHKCLQIAQDVGDVCEEDIQCTTTFGGGSHCSQETCQCKDLYQFKAKNSTCVKDILLNEICSSHSECHQPGRGPSRLYCILGQCKCRIGYREEEGYCIESSSHALKPVFILYSIIIFCVIISNMSSISY